MGLASEPVDYNIKYIIKANNVEYKTWVPETVSFYKAILDKFNINYTVTKENVT
jgi:hypothetical protein